MSGLCRVLLSNIVSTSKNIKTSLFDKLMISLFAEFQHLVSLALEPRSHPLYQGQGESARSHWVRHVTER